jgi:hypothetical protein
VQAALADGDVPPAATAWLGEVVLEAADGEPTPASGLVLPGSQAARLLDDRVLAPVSEALVERWGPDVLVAVGVRDHLALTTVPDVLVDHEAPLSEADDTDLASRSLDGWEEYLEELAERLGAGAFVGDIVAVADLDAVRDDAWPRVVAEIAGVPDLRRALLEPVRAEGPAGSPGSSSPRPEGAAPSYTAWWLRHRTPQALGLGEPYALPGLAAGLDALVRPAPDWLIATGVDEVVLRALGGVGALEDLDPAGWSDLLDALGPVGAALPPAVASALWRALARAAVDGVTLDALPERLPALVGPAEVRLVHADDAVVVGEPMWLQRTDLGALVPAPTGTAAALAPLLDLPRCEDTAPGVVTTGSGPGPERVPTPPAVLALVPQAPAEWWEHEELHVDGVPVDWWVEGAGPGAAVHATHLAALARGLAQAAGDWPARHALETVLADADRAPELVTEAMLDPR